MLYFGLYGFVLAEWKFFIHFFIKSSLEALATTFIDWELSGQVIGGALTSITISLTCSECHEPQGEQNLSIRGTFSFISLIFH